MTQQSISISGKAGATAPDRRATPNLGKRIHAGRNARGALLMLDYVHSMLKSADSIIIEDYLGSCAVGNLLD